MRSLDAHIHTQNPIIGTKEETAEKKALFPSLYEEGHCTRLLPNVGVPKNTP